LTVGKPVRCWRPIPRRAWQASRPASPRLCRAASYSTGRHFEARLAHVHGALFSVLNVALGFVLGRLSSARDRARCAAGWLGLAGLLMPVGILGEVYLGLSPVFVLVGAASMTASVVLTGVLTLGHWGDGKATT